MFRNTRNGAWYFHPFQCLFQFCFETTEMFELHVSVHFNNFPIYNPIFSMFQNTRNGAWYFRLFQILFHFCFETFWNEWNVWTLPTFFMFQSISIISLYNHIFSILKHQKWDLVFSPFPELVSILFRNNRNVRT